MYPGWYSRRSTRGRYHPPYTTLPVPPSSLHHPACTTRGKDNLGPVNTRGMRTTWARSTPAERVFWPGPTRGESLLGPVSPAEVTRARSTPAEVTRAWSTPAKGRNPGLIPLREGEESWVIPEVLLVLPRTRFCHIPLKDLVRFRVKVRNSSIILE